LLRDWNGAKQRVRDACAELAVTPCCLVLFRPCRARGDTGSFAFGIRVTTPVAWPAQPGCCVC
jgi:hypothetical protein